MTRGPWTPAERQQLLDLLREGTGYRRTAALLDRSEQACRDEAERLRAEGQAASGARARRRSAPASRRCLRCREPFAPLGRFNFLCRTCGLYAERAAA